MYKNSKIGIVILNYKDSDNTKKLCQLISEYNLIDKIVVVDNLSPDDSFERLIGLKSDKIDVLQSDKNGGYSYGNNYGAFYLIKKYNIDILFIANPDVEFSEKFVLGCAEILSQNIVQATSGIMLYPNGDRSKWNGKINSYFEDLIDCTIFIKKLIINYGMDYAKKQNNLIYVDFLPGSLFAINANIFKKIGGFDEDVFLYYEESILSLKLKKEKCKLAISNSLSFKHIHSGSIDKSIDKIKQLRQLYKSRLYLHKKYFNESEVKIVLLKIFMSYGIFMRKIIYKFLY